MMTTLKTLISATVISMVAITSMSAQCASHGCNPALNGMEFTSSCVATDATTTTEVTWTMGGGDATCLAPAGSWKIQISLPVTGQYGVEDALSVNGDGFDWEYDAENVTLNGTSNVDMTWLQSGIITVTVAGLVDNGCVSVGSNANIAITPNVLGGCTQAFTNQTSDDNATASVGVDIASTSVPVDLVGFTAKRQEEKALLEWTTRVEVNNKGFDIQRSEDGANYETIGHVQAQDATTFENHYSFVDESPARGLNYYRLKQIDNNGDYTYSPIRQVSFDGPQGGKIRFSPNPVIDEIEVQNLTANKIETIYITDDANKLIRTIQVDATQDRHKYDLSELNSGVYYVRFVGGTDVITEKLIKLSF